jgi:basic membrane protein A and related proteins
MSNVNLVGQTLGGRYQIQSLIGQGGMASVYKAYDPNLRRAVAIKVIHPHLANNPEFFHRFEEEATSVAKLRHPNIVDVFDFNHEGEIYYMVMEFVMGETLQTRLHRLNASKRRLNVNEAVLFTEEVCDAAFYAHQRGMIHRDIKPANIMLDVNGKAILMDFGIARMVGGSQHTATGAVLGTVLYMSPEQIQGLQIDGRADIYSIGITLFEMLSGKPPFEADSAMTLMMMHLNDPVPNLQEIHPDTPIELVTIINKALAKRRDDRFQTAGDMESALRKWSEPLQKTSATVSPPAPIITRVEDTEKTLLETSGVLTPTKEPSKPMIPGIHCAATRQESPPTLIDKTTQAAEYNATIKVGSIPVRGPLEGKKRRVWIPILSVLLILILVGGGYFAYTRLLLGGGVKSPTTVPTTASIAVLPPSATPFADVQPTHTIQQPIFNDTATKTPVFPPVVTLKVGLVTDGGKITDKSFNQSAWEGILKAHAAGNADFIQYIETSNAQDYDKNIDSFASDGYNVVVTVGFNLADATYVAAMKYPKIYFIGVDQMLGKDDKHLNWPLPNMISIVFNEDQSGFMVGALAAMMSATHKIGAVCGADSIPAVWRFGEGYKAGAGYADDKNGTNTEVSVVYHNEVGIEMAFSDPAWGAMIANLLIDQGVDIIFGCGGETGNGAVNAAAQRNIYVIGVDTDQYFTLPEAASRLLSSAIKLEAEPIATLIGLAKEGKFPSTGIFQGPSGYAPYHELESKVPEEVKFEMEAIMKDLNDGTLKTNVLPVKPSQ